MTIMFKAMLLPSILVVWGTAHCWAVAEATPPADLAVASSHPIPSVVQQPEGLTMSQYLQKRLDSHPQSQVHQRHTLLTPRELALDFLNWSKDPDKPTTATPPVFPKYEIPSTTSVPPLPTPKKPLSHAIYSSSLDAMSMNKVAQTSSSRNVFSRRRYTDTPFHLGPDSNKWAPVTSSDTVTTSRNQGGSHQKQDFSFEGGGGGLDPRLMNKKPAYTQTDSFRQKDASAEPEEVTKRRSRQTTTFKPHSRYSKWNKQNRNPDSYNRNSEKLDSRDESPSLSTFFKADEHTGPHASPELRWSNGSLIDDKSKSKFLLNIPPTFKVDGSSDLNWQESSEKQIDDHNNYSFLGSPEVVGYYRNNEKNVIKSTHNPSAKIQISFEVDPPVSKELPKYTYIVRGEHNSKNGHNKDTKLLDRSNEVAAQSPERKFREDDSNLSEGKSEEDGPYRYKTSIAAKSKENEKPRTTTTESPHHSYDKNGNSNEETTKFADKKRFETPIYRPKTKIMTNHYRFRLRPKSSETHKHGESETHKHDDSDKHDINLSHKYDISNSGGKEDSALYSPETSWSSEKLKARHDEPSKVSKSTHPHRYRGRTTTEKSYFEPSPTDSNETHLSSRSRSDSSKGSRSLEEKRSPFEGYRTDDHFPKGHKDSSKSYDRELRPSSRYESQEMYTKIEQSKERPSQKSRTRSKWNETDKRSREPSSRSEDTTTRPKGPKDRSRGASDRSRESSKHSRESSKRSRVPASPRSKERKTTSEIVDEYAVHHIAGPPYHDSISVDVVETLEKEGGPSYIPKSGITHEERDSYEVAVDKFLDDDDPFNFEEHSFNDSPGHDPPIVYYEQDAHSARQSTERSLENASPRTIDIKTSSHFGDVIDDKPTISRRKPLKASGGDHTQVFDELVYEYEGKHSPLDDQSQNHRYDPESVIGSNDPFDFGKNIGRAISYFEKRDPFSGVDSVRGISHHNAQEPRLEVMSLENHVEGITRHEPFGHQDALEEVSHDYGRFQYDPFSQADQMEGEPRQHQSDIYQPDPFHYEGYNDDIARHVPDFPQHDYMRPRDNKEGRPQVVDHIDENTPPNFFESSRRYPMDTNRGPAMVKHGSFNSLPVDEAPASRPQSSHDFSREPRFQVSYEQPPPEQSWGSRRLPTTTFQPQRPRDRRTKPQFDLNRNLRDEHRYRKVPPNRSNDPTPHSRGQRDRGRSRDKFSANAPRDLAPVNGPRERIPISGPRDRRSRARSRDETRAREKDGRSQGPNEQQWNFQDIMSLGFPNNIGQLFG